MALDFRRIVIALHAHPWTTGQLTDGAGEAAAYCAVGALLRDAGIPLNRIGVGGPRQVNIAAILEREYGISGSDTIGRIIEANDGAHSQSEAISAVLTALRSPAEPAVADWGGSPEIGTRLPPAA